MLVRRNGCGVTISPIYCVDRVFGSFSWGKIKVMWVGTSSMKTLNHKVTEIKDLMT